MLTLQKNRTADAVVSVEVAHAEATARVADLLEQLAERLPGMTNPTAPVHWGHVGSANEVARLLEQALRHA